MRIGGWLALGLVGISATAHADPPRQIAHQSSTTTPPRVALATEPGIAAHATTPPAEARPHLLYVELLGKGGAYGVGYEHSIGERLSLGVVGSFMPLRDQQLWTVSPYVHARVIGTRHSLFTELGAVLVHSRIPSPVEDWDGTSDTGAGGVATLGYQRTGQRIVVRAYGAFMVGEGGAAPWLGLAVGARL